LLAFGKLFRTALVSGDPPVRVIGEQAILPRDMESAEKILTWAQGFFPPDVFSRMIDMAMPREQPKENLS